MVIFRILWSMWLVTLKGNYFRGKRIWYKSKEGKSLVVCPSSIVVFPPYLFFLSSSINIRIYKPGGTQGAGWALPHPYLSKFR